MSRFIWLIACLPFNALLAGCSNADATPRFFTRSEWKSELHCPSLPALRHLGPAADVINSTDSTIAVLLSVERTIVFFDQWLRETGRIAFDKDGPRGILRPISLVVTDSIIFIADDARSAIRKFKRDGSDAGTIHLPFIPRRVRMAGVQLIVTPLVSGGSPANLLFEIRGAKAVPLGGAIARHDDVGINTMANMTSVAGFADRVVVMHEMVVPFGYVARPGSAPSSAQLFAVPLAAETKDRIGRLPKTPLSDRNVNDLSVVAFTAAAEPMSGSTYYVTRTGDGRSAPYRKLLVRLDSLLQLRDVFPIDANPHHMTFFPRRGSLIMVDSDSEWFECKVSPVS